MTSFPEADDISRADQIRVGLTSWCAQCYRARPISDFIGTRGTFVIMCSGCRDRYGNWHERSVESRARARRRVVRTGTGSIVSLTLVSKNRKTGEIPVSTTDMVSCPDACPHRDAGCYAGYGKAAYHWRSVPRRGITWPAFCDAIAALPIATLWRHNEAGDLPGRADDLDLAALAMLVRSNAGRRGFTFTHKPLRHAKERRAIARANREGFTINLSADSMAHADELADLQIGPVAVVLPSNAPEKSRTPAGRHVIVCPAETRGLTCKDCGLCAVADRKAIVGFRAHGQAAALVSLRVRDQSAPLSR